MKYERFEELPVWQVSADLAATMFTWTDHPIFRGKGDLANQIQRATLSISNNIAEGFERGTTNELLQFLYIARGSAGEVRLMLSILERMDASGDFKSEISNLKSTCESISRQLRGWANSLQNSDIAGPRHLNDRSRKEFELRKKREAASQERRAFQSRFEADLKEKAKRRAEGEEG